MRISHAMLLAGALLLSGCAAVEKQAFNRGAHTGIRSITILEPKPSEGFGVQVVNHPALGFGLIGASIYAAEMSSKSSSLDYVMRPLGWRLSEALTSALESELIQAGYTVKRAVVNRDGFATIKNYTTALAEITNMEVLETDAWLDLATRDPLYVANSPTSDYVPSIGVTARLVTRKGQTLLYREDVFFGFAYNLPRLEAVVIPSGAEYRFPGHQDLLANPERTLEGVKQGVPLIARRLASDLARDTSATTPVGGTGATAAGAAK